jgi:Family of unknown function (DUF6338)
VIPSTLLGLVVLAASIGPGYVWIRVAEARVPRGPRTQLLEIAELIVIGGLFSTIAFLGVLAFADWSGWIDTNALAAEGTDYVIRHTTRGLSVVVVGLAVAYAGAFAVARWIVYRKYRPRIGHGFSAWYSTLIPKDADHAAYATVDLRDGTTVAGWVTQVTTGEVPVAERDLVLRAEPGKPLKVRPPSANTFVDSPDGAIVLNGSDVLTVSASYYSMSEFRDAHKALNEMVDETIGQVVAGKTKGTQAPPSAHTP